MTNYENLAQITECEDSVEIEAVKMLLCKIHNDVEGGLFECNYSQYLNLYKSQVDWLNSEAKAGA